jgi:hypothetical protein
MWGYGNIPLYEASPMRIITCGVNGSANDVAFADFDEVSQRGFRQSISGWRAPSDEYIAHTQGKGRTYFEQPNIAPYFRNFR